MTARTPPTGQQLKAWREQGLLWKEIEDRTGYERTQLYRIYISHTKGVKCCPSCGHRIVRAERAQAAA